LLHSIVRNCRPKSYLELGTAYGISALIAARTLPMLMDDWRLTTIEYRDQQFQDFQFDVDLALWGPH
jgi:predicted O-methyltransferase YrrM